MTRVKGLLRGLIRRFGIDVVRLQKKSTRTNRLTYHQTATGNYYLPSDATSDVVANTIIANGIFEEEVISVARQYVREGTAVLDVGANFGQMSILVSDMVGLTGRVYSFEADEFLFGILKKNIAANQKSQIVEPIFGAVSDRLGDTLYFPIQDFERFEAYASYGIDPNAKTGREVTTVTIDSLNIQMPISFMKIDIQGFDLRGMQGAVATIARHRMPILFEYEYVFEEEYGFNFQQYVDFVRSIDYRFAKVINGHNFLILPN